MIEKYIKKYKVHIIIGILVIAVTAYSLISNVETETPVFNPENNINERDDKETYIYIDIKGQVLNPGVYKVEEGTRLFQLIHLAGGFTSEADELSLNLSLLLHDEDKYYVPKIGEEVLVDLNPDPDSDLININDATITEFETLPGIGPKTAESIVSYRDEHGDFRTLEDIMEVPGIGESTFNEIKSHITI